MGNTQIKNIQIYNFRLNYKKQKYCQMQGTVENVHIHSYKKGLSFSDLWERISKTYEN